MRCVWYRATGFFLCSQSPAPCTLYWPRRPWSHHLPPVPASSCTRYLAAPRGMRHAAWGMGPGVGRGQGTWLSQQKKEHAASLFCPEPDSLTVTPKEREQHEQHQDQDQQQGSSRQKEGKSLRNEARSRVGNKSLMKILGPFLLILS